MGRTTPLLDLVDRLAHVEDQVGRLLRVDAPHHVDVDVDVVPVLGLEGDLVGHRPVALVRVGVHQQVLLGDGQRRPAVDARAGRSRRRPARRPAARRASRRRRRGWCARPPRWRRSCRSPRARARPGARGRGEPPGPGARITSSPRAERRAPAPPGPPRSGAQAWRTKVMYCSGVMTAPSMLSNILAVSRATT